MEENKDKRPEETGTDEEMSLKEFAQGVLGRAKEFVQEKADQTDLDEKAVEFVRGAAETAKGLAGTAVEKTKEFVEKNDLEDKAKRLGDKIVDTAKKLFDKDQDA